MDIKKLNEAIAKALGDEDFIQLKLMKDIKETYALKKSDEIRIGDTYSVFNDNVLALKNSFISNIDGKETDYNDAKLSTMFNSITNSPVYDVESECLGGINNLYCIHKVADRDAYVLVPSRIDKLIKKDNLSMKTAASTYLNTNQVTSLIGLLKNGEVVGIFMPIIVPHIEDVRLIFHKPEPEYFKWNDKRVADVVRPYVKNLGIDDDYYDGRFDTNEYDRVYKKLKTYVAEHVKHNSCVIDKLETDGHPIYLKISYNKKGKPTAVYQIVKDEYDIYADEIKKQGKEDLLIGAKPQLNIDESIETLKEDKYACTWAVEDYQGEHFAIVDIKFLKDIGIDSSDLENIQDLDYGGYYRVGDDIHIVKLAN